MRHRVYDLLPAVLVIMVAENLLIGMAPIAIGGEQPLVFARSGKTHQPFGARHLAAMSLRKGSSSVLKARVSVMSSKEGEPLMATSFLT
jgi:type IV secretory pathway TrbL component